MIEGDEGRRKGGVAHNYHFLRLLPVGKEQRGLNC